MIRKPLFKQTFSLLVLIGITDFFANTFYLYWTVWWIDIIMHFVSGVCVGMAGVLVWQYFFDENISLVKSIKLAFLFSLSVGILWEVFELSFEVTSFKDGVDYITDTTSDVILDISGGLLGGLYGHKLLNKNKK